MKRQSVNPKKKKAHAPKFVPNFLEVEIIAYRIPKKDLNYQTNNCNY